MKVDEDKLKSKEGVYSHVRRSVRYAVLGEIAQKKSRTVKTWFNRNDKDIDDPEHIQEYLRNFHIIR